MNKSAVKKQFFVYIFIYLLLEKLSFWDIAFAFDIFSGDNIKSKNNGFGSALLTLKRFGLFNSAINSLSEYHIWTVLSGLTNVESIHLNNLNPTEIPPESFIPLNATQIKLETINLESQN